MDVNPEPIIPAYEDILHLFEERLLMLENLHLELSTILAMLRVMSRPTESEPEPKPESGPYL